MLTRSTIGKLLIEEALPEEMRGRNLTFDKKTVQSVLREIAQNHPDKYVEVSKKLADIGRQVATETGGFSFGLESLRQPESAKKTIGEIKQKVKALLAAPNLTDKQRQEAIVRTVGGYQQGLMQDIYKETLAAKNPIAMQIMSGSRGNVMNLASLLGSDLLYEDHRGDIIPLPVLHSYSQGLSPAEYWAGTYGARKGVIATKFATADAGFFGKQLNQVAHRLAVVDQDDPRQDMGVRGFPVDTDDMDNEGALLAHDFGGYKRNTVLTPKILKDLKGRGFDRLLVRSPLTGGSPDGGVYARDVGVRERGVLPGRGEMVGMTAAQALAEPISQGQLSAKHSGGVAGQEKTVGGFQYIDQLIQVPKTFKGGAAHTTVDGKVQKIEDAPAGGKYIFINDKPQYVGQGFDIKVKPGDEVEAGDVLSEGIPNPSIVTQYKGIGEGRRYFTKAFRDALGAMGLRSHRRNIELVGRGLIDHVRLTEEYGDHVPDDVVPYSTLEHTYKPRDGALTTTPDRALNKYLEKPALHYTIGTQIKPSMLKDFKYFGVNDVTVHEKPAPFEPEMIRAMYNLHHDPDWMTRMYGSGLKGSLLEATHRGSTSSATGTSFVAGLSKGTDFGRVGVVQQPKMGLKPELNTPTPTTPATPKPEKMASDDILPGGMGDKYNVSDFDPKEMKKGIKTEMEHTVSPEIAADISKDHLVEDPKYYTKLEKVEKKSTYSVASGIAKTRNKKADDASIKPETGSSTAKPNSTTGAPPKPAAPSTTPSAATTPPQIAPAGNSNINNMFQTQIDNFAKNIKTTGQAVQDIGTLTGVNNLMRPTDYSYMNTGDIKPTTYKQEDLIGMQKTQPIQPKPANQITPQNTLPVPAQPQTAPPSAVAPVPTQTTTQTNIPTLSSAPQLEIPASASAQQPQPLTPLEQIEKNHQETQIKKMQEEIKTMLQQRDNENKKLISSENSSGSNFAGFGLSSLIGLGLNAKNIATSPSMLSFIGRGLTAPFDVPTPLGSGVTELAANRNPQNIMSSVDSWRNLVQTTGEKLEKRQYLPALRNSLMAGAYATLNPASTAIDAIYGFGPPGDVMSGSSGKQIRRAAIADANSNNPAYNQDIPGFRQGEDVPKEFQDKRTFLEQYTPSYVFGKDAPSLASQQTPAVQLQMSRRNVWQSRSPEQNKQAIRGFKTRQEADEYFFSLDNIQQQQFNKLVDELEYEYSPEGQKQKQKDKKEDDVMRKRLEELGNAPPTFSEFFKR